MCSREKRYGVNPAAPPRPCLFMIICGLLCSRLIAAMTKHTEDAPRKRYIREWRIYQQYMDDQEKQEQEKQKVSHPNPSRPSLGRLKSSHKTQTITDRLREVASVRNIRQRLHRRRYQVKEGSPPPKPPPYCPHWHKARPKPQKAWTKVRTERLRVYEPGHKSRLERYEERLLDPTSKESRYKAARGAGYSSTATTLCGAPTDPETELVSMFGKLRELERWNEQVVEMSEEGVGELEEQLGQDEGEMYRVEHSSTEGFISGARSLGTVALKGKGKAPTKKFVQKG